MSEYNQKVNLFFSLPFWTSFVLWIIGVTDLIIIETFDLMMIGLFLMFFTGLFKESES